MPKTKAGNINNKYKVYKRRYYILFLYGVATLFNAMCRVNNNQIRELIRNVYEIPSLNAHLITLIYPVLFIPGIIAATIVYNKFSIRTGLIIGVALQAVGAGIKVLLNYAYYVIYIGQTF